MLALVVAAPGAASSFNQDPIPLTDEQVLQLVMRDERMTVPVNIADAGPWPFIIDTGAQRTVISRELANVLKLERGRDVMLTAITGRSQVRTAVIPNLRVSVLGGAKIEAPALAARHLGATGMLGIDSLQGHKVTINFDNDTMTVQRAERRGRGARAHPDEVVVTARSYLGQLVVTNAYYNGRPIRVVLDTGSPVSIGNEPLRKLVARQSTRPLEVTSVTGETLSIGYTQLNSVKFGSLEIQNLPIAFSIAAPFKQFKLDKRPALLLGMDALKLFRRVEIDFVNRELRLTKLREGRRPT